MHRLNVAGPLTVVAQATRPNRIGRRIEERRCHILVQYDGEKLVAEAATPSEATQAGRRPN